MLKLVKGGIMQNLHICTHKYVCLTNFGLLGKVGVIFSLQLTSRTQFAKIKTKKVIAENQCEKHELFFFKKK